MELSLNLVPAVHRFRMYTQQTICHQTFLATKHNGLISKRDKVNCVSDFNRRV